MVLRRPHDVDLELLLDLLATMDARSDLSRVPRSAVMSRLSGIGLESISNVLIAGLEFLNRRKHPNKSIKSSL